MVLQSDSDRHNTSAVMNSRQTTVGCVWGGGGYLYRTHLHGDWSKLVMCLCYIYI